LPIGVLISGQGTNLNAILQQCEAGTLDAAIRVVISNRGRAAGLSYGRIRGIPTFVCAREDYPSREAQQRAMKERLIENGVELVVLAGFDQILGDDFVEEPSYRIVNLHPSLLPAFSGGMHAVGEALACGVKVTGCTVHFVLADDPKTDGGPIILQEPVAVLDDDTETSLLARVHEAEHRILPAAIQLYAEGRLSVQGRRVRIAPRPV
jgi:phosphoribosylglycinamide formyltransferase-1